MNIREKVEALTGYSSHAVADMMNDETWIRKADVLALLGKEKFKRIVQDGNSPGGHEVTRWWHVSDERKGQRRVEVRRMDDATQTVERRGEG